MKNFLSLFALSVLLASPAANACSHVKVYNESDRDIWVLWIGLGCAQVSEDVYFICNKATIPAKAKNPVGANIIELQSVVFRFEGTGEMAGKRVESKYTYHRKHHPKLVRCDFGNCDKERRGGMACGDFTIHFTDENVSDDSKWYFENVYKAP